MSKMLTMPCVVHCFLTLFLVSGAYGAVYNIVLQTRDNCKTAQTDTFHEFYDSSQLICSKCSQDQNFQTVSADGLRCICQPGYRIIKDFGGTSITCEACPSGQATSSNLWECVYCQNGLDPVTNLCLACDRESVGGTLVPNKIAVERKLDGSWINNPPERTCETCAESTGPNADGTQCKRCNQVLSSLPSETTCICPALNEVGGVCFQDPTDFPEYNIQLYTVNYGGDYFESTYFRRNVQAAIGMCMIKYGNSSACQALGNMCVLTLYRQRFVGTLAPDACAHYEQLRQQFRSRRVGSDWIQNTDNTNTNQNADTPGGTNQNPDTPGGTNQNAGNQGGRANRGNTVTTRRPSVTVARPPNMPWLYYEEETANQILKNTGIPTQYTFPNTKLKFMMAEYTLNGTFLGYRTPYNGFLQLCKNTESVMNAAYTFGTTYDQKCDVSVRDFWNLDLYRPYFYDMYLEYDDTNGDKKLFAIPVKVNNFEDANGDLVNQGADPTNWKLTRRFFLVDNISGKEALTITDPVVEVVTTPAKAVRYLQSITIHIELQDNTKDGLIYPPYLELNYGYATTTEYEVDQKAQISFNVKYTMDVTSYNNDISIAIGVLSALAIVWSGLQTWGWARRSGRIAIDFPVLVKFVIFGCGNIANVLFAVTFGAAIWWFIFFKRQSTVYLIMPNSSQQSRFVAFLASAFVLKLLQLIHLLVVQCTIDIFFIDWERPRGKAGGGDAATRNQEASVSIWRTYFVANEWNEIQTTRKINEVFQLFCVVLFLSVIGFGNLATMDPNSNFSRSADNYYSPDSSILRYAIAGLVYLITAVVQWVFYTFVYERFIEDKVRQYVDLCSMSNVSVFLMESAQFGYYIHGRSAHGRADTGMREMHENLKREEEDLCGKRGLIPNTEQQTFMMAVPPKLRQQYDRVLRPIYEQQNPGAKRGQGGGTGANTGIASHVDSHTEQCIQAYGVLNRFLQGFIDHSLRDVDYIVKDKNFVENVMNIETTDPVDKGFFYNDSGHSFDSVLFFGHENTLVIFEILWFCFIDLLAQNYVLSAVLTYILMRIINMIRDSLGRSNLAKKTLVDKRFLI